MEPALPHHVDHQILQSALLPFAALILGFVSWTVVVVVFFPRLLGLLLSFIANRAARGTSYISIPTLHIYPLAGRIVAHSVRFTNQDLTFLVEEFVLQCRWWRRHEVPDADNEVLIVDNPEILNPVALIQQKIDQENSARFLKRIWYRLRRWWHRSAVTKDSNNDLKPAPLISLILVGLRVRAVNQARNYSHVASIVEQAARSRILRSTTQRNRFNTALSSNPTNTETQSNSAEQSPSSSPSSSSSTSSSMASDNPEPSVESIDKKPFIDRILELSSLRINNGAIYICDMGQSPLMRITLDTAKLRYQYGAASCPADLCRKRIFAGVSSLRLSIASQSAVKSVSKSSSEDDQVQEGDVFRSSQSDGDVHPSSMRMVDNTERLVQRVMSMGHRGINDPFWEVDMTARQTDRLRYAQRSFRENLIKKFPSLRRTRKLERRESRKSQTLPCIDILHSTTAVVQYVFDEPGLTLDTPRRRTSDLVSGKQHVEINVSQPSQDDSAPLPPPVCRLTMLFKGAEGTYDAGAVADIDRVIERLEPKLYDCLSQAEELQSKEGKRLATAMQIQIDATPKSSDLNQDSDTKSLSLLRVPFTPQRSSWIGLLASKLRMPDTSHEPSVHNESSEQELALPESHLDVQCSQLSVRTEIPLTSGAQQKMVISIKDAHVQSNGVVDMPLIDSKSAVVTRVTYHPEVWNEEVVTTTDVELFKSDVLYVPDFMRIIGDVSTTMQQQGRKPPAVNYFIPYKETIIVHAKDEFCINLSCGRDNAWKDVMSGIGDEYGKLKLQGKYGEFSLIPANAAQYNADASSLSWSLSLPDVRANLELLLPSITPTENETDAVDVTSRSVDLSRSGHQHRVLAPLQVPRRTKSAIDSGDLSNLKPVAKKNNEFSPFNIEILRFEGAFDLKGKVLSNEDLRSFSDSAPTFLDAVNISDLNFHANSLLFDLNPYHFSHILNVIRNYGGVGTHTISTSEFSKLENLRKQIARDVILGKRLPTRDECLILGLYPGYTLPSSLSRPGLDDLFRMRFQIDTVLLRLHELPHARCPFDFSSQNICSVFFDRLTGEIAGNRLGSELILSPSSNNTVALYGGCISSPTDLSSAQSSRIGRATPSLKIENMQIRKHSLASENWSSYFSSFQFSIDKLSGCLLDMTVASLSRMGLAFFPDSVSESIISVAALLSIDNLELSVNSFDLLIISPSSVTSAKTMSKPISVSSGRNDYRQYRRVDNLPVPKFLAGVTQLQFRDGLRFVSSSLAFEQEGFLSRFLLPSIMLDVLVPAGGKPLTWVDEVTVRTQIVHQPPRRNSSLEVPTDSGIMSRAFEVRGMAMELVYGSRPSYWLSSVPRSQSDHVLKQHQVNRRGSPPWCTRRHFKLPINSDGPLNVGLELEMEWWDFMQHSTMAKVIYKHRQNVGQRADALSVRFPTETVIFICPEFLELCMEIIQRAKESAIRYDLLVRTVPSRTSVRLDEDSISRDAVRFNPDIFSNDLLALWNEFEKYKQPAWMTNHDRLTSGSSFKALETQSVTIIFLSPTFVSDTMDMDSVMLQIFSDDQIFVSIPSGIHIFKELRFDVKRMDVQQDMNNQLPDVMRTDLLYTHLATVNVGCNDVSIMKVQKVVLVNREKNYMFTPAGVDSGEDRRRRDRKTSIGKIESLHIGKSPADLSTYASFGRVASIFMLMIRAVIGEMDSLSEVSHSRLTTLCETVMSCSSDEVLVKDPDFARSFFVGALKFSEENRNETTLVDGVSLSSFTIPGISAIRKRSEISTQTMIHSIDVTMQNMSLTLDDQEIVRSDGLSCKGGKTSGVDSTNASDLEGYVLNAAFGTISLSIRDDVAARTFLMIGRVASCVQKTYFSLPLLHPGGRHESEKFNLGSSTFSPPPRGNNMRPLLLTVPTMMPSFQSSRNPAHSRQKLSRQGLNTRRSLLKSRPKSVSFQLSERRASIGSIPTSLTNAAGGYQSMAYEERNVDTIVSPLLNPGSDEEFVVQQGGFFEESGSPTKSPIAKVGIVRNRSFTNSPSLTMLRSPEDNDERMIEDGSKSVSIRTAGDSGPPRKRARCLIPVTPVVPPAFTAIANRVNRANRASANLRKSLETFPKFSQSPRTPTTVPTFESRSIDSTYSSLYYPHTDSRQDSIQSPKRTIRPNVTLFVSCREFVSRYYRGQDCRSSGKLDKEKAGNITFVVDAPRLTFMSHPESHRYSVVFTASSSKLFSSNNPHCVLTGSIAQIGGTISESNSHDVSALPKLLISCCVTEFKVTLVAKDLRSVQRFRDEFRTDLKGVLTAFFKTKNAVTEMAKTTRLYSTRDPSQNTTFSTLAFDIIFEKSEVKLEGFHPNDINMSMSYVLDGIFFSVVASEDDNAALTLGLRLYGHGLLLSSPSWPRNEFFQLPSFDARGVQWSESMGLPTTLKVTTEPLVCLTSFQGLRHVLFTVAGLLAFQNKGVEATENIVQSSVSMSNLPSVVLDGVREAIPNLELNPTSTATGASPFTRSFTAWERTKGVRMDISIRPIALSLASGQVVALFNLETVTGSFEWNKLVVTGVQLRMSVSAAKVSLCFMRMPTTDFSAGDVRNDDKRSSLSIVLEKSHINLLKKQEDLTHTFIFRTNISAVSGQVRPWRLLLDAAVWADEQEFVSDFQSINYNALSASRQRPPRSQSFHDTVAIAPTEHRLILFGANIQRVVLAIPLVSSEHYATARLAIRATDLHVLARHRFDSIAKPVQNIFEVKCTFIGILWENSSLLSSHHAQITLGVRKSPRVSSSHLGALTVVMVPGTWRICPRKDVVIAILEAKNRKDNKVANSAPFFGHGSGVSFNLDNDQNDDSVSNATEKEGRLLVEKLSLKVLRTSGFIEGLENEFDAPQNMTRSIGFQRGRKDSMEKVSVPAFSISFVRQPNEDFDLIDVDFSGREGEFPKGCLQRVSNLFSDLFGVVASDQERTQQQHDLTLASSSLPLNQQSSQQPREISRNMSMLIRFGRSLYRAQEEANLSIESKFGLFASKHSALLVSVRTGSVLNDGCSHTTVISGVSPKLALEITPLLDGAVVQSLRLADVRFLHGFCSSHAPHTVFHISRVTALMEAKTLLLTQNRLQQNSDDKDENVYRSEKYFSDISKRESQDVGGNGNITGNGSDGSHQERKLMFVLGKPREKRKGREASAGSSATGSSTAGGDGRESEKRMSEPNIRLQLNLSVKSTNDDNDKNQAILVLERLHIGLSESRIVGSSSENDNHDQNDQNESQEIGSSYIGAQLNGNKTKIGGNVTIVRNVHCAVHNVAVRGSWDILMFELQLHENLFYYDRNETIFRKNMNRRSVVANIINRLHVENMQYGKRTLKLDVDALAAKWMVPSREVDIESTKVKAEVSHTLIKAINKFSSQWKKLRNEVKLLTERDTSKRKGKSIAASTKIKGSGNKNATPDVTSQAESLGNISSRTFLHGASDDTALVESVSNTFLPLGRQAYQNRRDGSDSTNNTIGNRIPAIVERSPLVSAASTSIQRSGVPAFTKMPTGSLATFAPTSATISDIGVIQSDSDLVEGGVVDANKKKEKTRITIRGDEMVLMMRGYQFDETRHSAMISVFEYQVGHVHDFENDSANEDGSKVLEIRILDVDFKNMLISYNDDERSIRSELCTIPSPNLKLSIRDRENENENDRENENENESGQNSMTMGVDVTLVGDLEVKLGHGFYNFQEFRELLELTIQGIAPVAPAPSRGRNGNNQTSGHEPSKTGTTTNNEASKDRGNKNRDRNGNRKGRRDVANDTNDKTKQAQKESISSNQSATSSVNSGRRNARGQQGVGESSDEDDGLTITAGGQVWDGKRALTVLVRLNPRIDVIGDLTADVMPMVSAKLIKQVEAIPKHMFDYIVMPLELFSKTLCDPLQQ